MNKQASSSNDWKSVLSQIESQLDLYLVDKAPSIPKQWKEILVKIAPWLIAIGVIFSLPAILAIFGFAAVFSPFAYMGGLRYGAGFSISWIFLLIALVLNILALPGLFKRAKQGWYFLYYGALVSAVQNLVTFNLGGLIIGTLLSLYILFQLKEYYK